MAGRVKESDARQLAALVEEVEAKGFSVHFVRMTNSGGLYTMKDRALPTYFYICIRPYVKGVPSTLEGRDVETLRDQIAHFPNIAHATTQATAHG